MKQKGRSCDCRYEVGPGRDKGSAEDDRLLTVEEVCQVLNVTEQWVYHDANKMPFIRKVGGLLRFSSNRLRRYIESTKFTVRGY